MDQDNRETQAPLFEESHPWTTLAANAEEDDSVDEVIGGTLDEVSLA